MPKLIVAGTVVLLTGLILLPVAVYMVGGFLAGGYESDGGFPVFLGSIYTGLARGQLAAWTLTLSPALFCAAWWATAALWRLTARNAD